MAAGSLAGLGVRESLPVLIEGLSSEEELPYSDPPRSLSAFARFVLEQYTGESFSDAGEWQEWWDEAGGQLQFEAGRYVAE
jgi:hypothetical protein